ncbi:MAG: hypothetical protein H6R17_2675 [Proteobacteria bacterium]|nr:hypothetical protein [Pseudomonadota bacterium]
MKLLNDFAIVAFLFVLILLPRIVEVYLKKNDMKLEQYDWN